MKEINTREELVELFKNSGYRVGLEIGTHRGEFTEELCKTGLKIFTVDPWIGFSGQGRHQRLQEVQDGYYREAVDRLSPYSNCHIIRKTSMDALDDFQDGSLDFVYIDGDHSFRHIAQDLFEWSRKVRIGGIVSGHDYFNTAPWANNVICHVKAVVDAYREIYGITDMKLTSNDKHQSWFWIKK